MNLHHLSFFCYEKLSARFIRSFFMEIAEKHTPIKTKMTKGLAVCIHDKLEYTS